MTGKNRENYNKNYIAYVNSFAPATHHFKNCLRAFGVGGLICCIGQFFRYMLEYLFGLSGDELAGTVSVASPAIEFKTEGWIYGLAAKMFIVAGPIIVYGVLSGTLVGIIYWFLR